MDIILTLIPENDNITFFLGRRLALETTYELWYIEHKAGHLLVTDAL